uniref:Uncharacterized protein n=1 Tax=Tanacetum cinerariifolium TaxID=118510 RepID=A0A6L2M090_TANCI|nr:hypothetical protein [Tanacetum cinerariifolium]
MGVRVVNGTVPVRGSVRESLYGGDGVLAGKVVAMQLDLVKIMPMLYFFVNNIHVDYADLLREGLHNLLEHLTTLIPYPRFTKLIVSHYMTAFPKILRRACDKYHNVEDDEMVKSIFKQNANQNDPGTKLEPTNNKESLKVEINVVLQFVNVNEYEKDSAEDDYELKRREKGKHVKETRNSPSPITIRSPRIHSSLISSDTKKLQELTVTDPKPSSSTPSSSSLKPTLIAKQQLLSLFKPKIRRFK